MAGYLIIFATVKILKYPYFEQRFKKDDRYISKISPYENGEFSGFDSIVAQLKELNPCKSIYQQNQTLYKTIIKQESYNLMKSIYIKKK